MVFLNFFLDHEKDVSWLPFERPLTGLGRIDAISPAIGCTVLLILSQVVAEDKQLDVLVAGSPA